MSGSDGRMIVESIARATSLKMPAPFVWSAAHVAAIQLTPAQTAPLLTDSDVTRVGPDLDLWDAWPIQRDDGHPAEVAQGETLWMALAAPRFDDPDERHLHARIHLLSKTDAGWRDLGPAMPDGFAPGSREWSGSAVLDAAQMSVTLYFTAAGRRGEAETSFEQRLFRAEATLKRAGAGWRLDAWRGLAEIIARDPLYYMETAGPGGHVGTIKAFRDPAYFRDPADGQRYLFFAGSCAASRSSYNGVIGAAVSAADGDPWRSLPPLLTADTLNNELERPHVVYHGGSYYLFWSTQRHVFNPDGPTGPTGLYGVVADRLTGPWRPLNGTGLVFANPASAHRQAYSWFVMPDLLVTSFVDDWGEDDAARARRFGATFAPMLRLRLQGDLAFVSRA